MSSSVIILDLMERLIKVEKEIEKLKEEKEYGYEMEDLIEEKENKKPVKRRSQLRDDVISKLKENNPDIKNVRVSNREEGSGITVEEHDGTKKSYVLRTSNNIASDKSHGWFTVGKLLAEKIIDKDLNGVILYSYYGDPEKDIVVIMDSIEFEGYMDEKGFENKDSNGRYHLYIQHKNDGIFEVRDGDIDISEFSNKFKIY